MDQASRAVRLIDKGQFKSIRQVSRAIDVAKSTIHDRRAGRQPRGQEARKLLSFEVSTARKRTLEDEVQETTKRLKKQDDKRTWDTTEIFKARGYTTEETAGYIDVLPNRALIYNVEGEPST
jgi:hypothetical protein